MQEEKIIQENLFAVNNESYKHISQKVITEDLSIEELKKEGGGYNNTEEDIPF